MGLGFPVISHRKNPKIYILSDWEKFSRPTNLTPMDLAGDHRKTIDRWRLKTGSVKLTALTTFKDSVVFQLLHFLIKSVPMEILT